MKISYRILFINFVIVVLILGSSALAFYSILYNVLSSQQTRYLLNSANNFIYVYRETVQDVEDDFVFITKNGVNNIFNQQQLREKDIDFVFETDPLTSNIKRKLNKEFVSLPNKDFNINNFLEYNPHAFVKKHETENGGIYYYGKIFTGSFLNDVSKKVSAEIALVWNDGPVEFSNASINQKYFFALDKAYKELSKRSNFDVHSEEAETADIIATVYKPAVGVLELNNLEFLIFTPLSEAADLRSNLKDILAIIGSAGVVLSLIFTFVFTDKIRKQITDLNEATKVTKDGNFKNKIVVKSKDEIGELAGAFNVMLNELEKNQRAKNEYSEFITLINKNPTLLEISEDALKKIINTARFNIGVLYLVEKEKISVLSMYGFKKDEGLLNKENGIFDIVIKNREMIEVNSAKELPIVSAGLISVQIKHLLVIPVVYNKKVIALLELGAVEEPSLEAKEYLSKIQEQLAIGLTNALAFVQLENLVAELKQLNEDYQKQNVQIRKQNETLIDLHKELKEKAEELEVQKNRAEEATKVKSQFLASMSHELRTPMNSILGLTELILEQSSLKGKNRERLEVVFKSGKRLMNLINDILDLSKIEAGKMEVNNENVLLDELIHEVETSISPLVENKGLLYKTVRNTNTRIIINTDRGKVTQVLINLLGNAIKFTDEGAVELHIHSVDNQHLVFDVVDTGIGISEENQKLVFEEFRQVDGTITRKYSGTGLGLTISKKIADLLQGSLAVKSTPGKGSTFTFSIPIKFVEAEEEKPLTVTEEPKVNVETLIKNRMNPILVIDDDAEVRYTIGQYLISKGYEVAYASDGEKGIEEAIKLQPFAITLDAMLPNNSGWNILRRLKEHPATKDIPIILISIMGDKNIGYGLGAFEYFVKPISAEQLLSAFSKLESLAKKPIEKIALVDDDEMEFEKFKREFKNEKVRIDYIQDSELAFSRILETQPDLIILDLIMPKVDGISLTYKLKSNRDTKHIPIIISTAKDITEDEKSSLQNIVEQITVKSKGHPLDVLKIVRDRLKMHELNSTAARPVKLPEENNIETEELINESSESEEVKDTHGTVLIVDDDSDTLFTINEIVQACECKTILASSGTESLRALEKTVPDLILLDIMMPGMDGFQTLKKIKENKRWATIPVFAVTAKAMLEDKEVILRHGFDDYIPKPVNAGIMAFKIEKLFSKQGIT